MIQHDRVIKSKRTSSSSKANAPRYTTTNTEILMLNTHLRNRNTQIKSPPKPSLREEDESNHSPLISRRNNTKQRAKNNHNKHRPGKLPVPMPQLTTKAGEKDSTEENSESLRQRQNDRVLPVRAAIRVEHCDHLRPQDARRVVEHIDDAERNDRRSEVAAPRASEDIGGRQRVFQLAEGFPQCEADEHRRADD